MPLPVVPSRPPARAFSRNWSSSLWWGSTTWARSLTTRFSATFTPRRRRPSISASRPAGSITMPLPRIESASGRRMPVGTRCSTNSSSPTCTVWPAFAPPWKRMTTSKRPARASITLPLPSSPH